MANRRRKSTRPPDAEILRTANAAAGGTQRQFATEVLGLEGLSGYTAWIGDPPRRKALGPAVRLAWLITQHPELADELRAAFGEAP